MPLRLPVGSTIMVVGSGPIVIGQACEFDYSGTQACKALKQLGFRVVLINSNPATIMTDEELADATYVEPLTLDAARQVIEREKPDAILPTVGGQVGLNLAMELAQAGVLEEHGVELIGADPDTIDLAEDRQRFKDAMIEIGVGVAQSGLATTLAEAEALLDKVDSKFTLVSLASMRARQINSYYNQLGDGIGKVVPPQVTSTARKALSIAFEEIDADKIVWAEPVEEVAEELSLPVGEGFADDDAG